jgi:hypothetical protein
MKNIHYYYLVKSGKAKEAIRAYIDGMHRYNDHLKSMCEKYGAKAWMTSGPFLVGLQFEKEPPAPWKHLPRKYRHYRNDVYNVSTKTKEGKALSAELHSVKHPEFHVDGKGDSWVTIDRYLYGPYFEIVGDKYILVIPINGQADKQFVPDGDLQLLKLSEYWRIKEESGETKAD